LRLVYLEINGFKSFADTQRLGFPAGMTAVVGPNGCGKSNISDALAWVLGEQRASLLRGLEMADVIFSGTSDRKPMGLAEVKLQLEMPDPALPGSVKEVVVSRRLYRDQGGEYRINGKECRLKDIQDLLMDTGMGTRAYSFIQQGQIDLILSSKPKDRRGLLEEAAGITRYKARRAEAEKRLEDTRANLLRLDDILHELGKQLESLRRQAAKARRAQELDAEIKAAQRILLSHSASELQKAKERIHDQLDQLERGIATLTAQASEKASEVELGRLAAEELSRALDRVARAVLGLDQRLGLAEQDLGFQQERAAEARAGQERVEGRLAELDAKEAGRKAEAAGLESALGQAGERLAEREAALAQATEAVTEATGAVRRVEGGLRDLRHRREERRKAQGLAQRQRQAIQAQLAQLEGRLDTLNHEESVRAPRLEGLQSEQGRLSREIEGTEAQTLQAEESVRLQGAVLRDREEAFRAAQQAHREAQLHLETEERRLGHLADHLRKASGAEAQAEALKWARERGADPRSLAEAIQVDEPVRADLERLLGAWLETVALGSGFQAEYAAAPGHLKISTEGGAAAATPQGCEPLRAHLRWRTPVHPLEALLDRAFRCADADFHGLALAHPELALVSPRLVKLPYGPIEIGVSAPAESPLKLQAELEAAREARERWLGDLETREAGLKASQTAQQEARERLEHIDTDYRCGRRKLEDLKGQKASVDAQLAEIAEISLRADELWERMEQEMSRLKGELREIEEHPEQLEDAALEQEIQGQEESLQEAHRALDAQREIQLEAARNRDAAWAERDAAERHLGLVQRAAFELEEEARRLNGERAEAKERETQAAARGAELEAEIQAGLEERRLLAGQQAELHPRLEEEQERLRVLERAAREFQEALENARSLHQDLLLQGAQVQGSTEAVAKEIELALALTVPDFLASISDEERAAWSLGELVHQTRLAELHGKRIELGGVNALAIQDLAESEQRLEFMHRQREDVLEAIANLEATIREINATSEERFREAFDFINARFQEVFREAFGGGQAHLALQDPKDLLECGIEIHAQPPGKSAKTMTLLSGGEKALTAISLLFAIFQFKPSPFCVLDEVDAPLDDANVARFAAMVQRMKAETQFIVITHQKPTMVAADTLYGVTMQERGVSTLVSVQLREAEQLV
jgi:chromosome segregation protein